MGKSRAEIQRAYRERKKAKLGSVYLEKECSRVQKYYKPTCSLTGSELQERRDRIRESVRKHRARAKPTATPGEEVVIKFDFNSESFKRRQRELKQARKKIKSLEERLKVAERKREQLRKRVARASRKTSTPRGVNKAQMTPRTRTNEQIREAGLTPRRLPPQLRKRLTFSNALSDEIRQSTTKNKSTKSKQSIRQIVSGKILKKYRMIHRMNKETGIGRNSLHKSTCKDVKGREKTRLRAQLAAKMEQIKSFLERDDNSRMMPGKNDAVSLKSGNEKVKAQKRILCDYMYNLHAKFQAEFPTDKISRATFCKLRPKHIMLAVFTTRDTCLCQRHQNMALKLRALKSEGVTTITNPDKFVNENDETKVKEILESLDGGEITFDQWKRVEEEGKKRMKMVRKALPQNLFVAEIEKETAEFRQHVNRVREQYCQLKSLKENLPPDPIIVQMDFAENYLCHTLEEVQSAYWNGTMVSLHPVVAYFKDASGNMQHKSIVFTSDELSHNSAAVFTILKMLIPELKLLLPSLKCIHYWTDSPTSQYRNKTIFGIIANHLSEFGVENAVWNYFEAGHGKGPCDGVGGTAKRMADEAVKTGKVVIQDAHEFFKWASGEEKMVTKYIFYSKEDYQKASEYLEKIPTLKVKGTMKLHAVFGESPGKIMVKTTSCYCDKCLSKDGEFTANTSCGWKRHASLSEYDGNSLAVNVDDFVCAVYDDAWYIGKVEEVDVEDIHITFMEKGKGKSREPTFKWPKRKDSLWVDMENVLCVIEPPVPVGKTGRSFQISSATLELIAQKFLEFQNKMN